MLLGWEVPTDLLWLWTISVQTHLHYFAHSFVCLFVFGFVFVFVHVFVLVNQEIGPADECICARELFSLRMTKDHWQQEQKLHNSSKTNQSWRVFCLGKSADSLQIRTEDHAGGMGRRCFTLALPFLFHHFTKDLFSPQGCLSGIFHWPCHYFEWINTQETSCMLEYLECQCNTQLIMVL